MNDTKKKIQKKILSLITKTLKEMQNRNQILADPCLNETKSKDKKPFVKCINKNKAVYACTNQDCKRFPFICPDDDCLCQKQHNICSLLVIKNIKRALKNKVVDLKPIQNIIQSFFEKMVDNIYNYKNQILQKIRKDFDNYFGLESFESDFLKATNNQTTNLITGKQLWKIQLNLKNVSKQSTKIKQAQQQIKDYCRKFQQEGKYLFQNITKKLQRYKIGLFFDSMIVKNEQQIKILQGLFLSKQIKKTTLLYRGSENKFDQKKFHKNCDGITHTLTICETQHGKKIGGYTPIAWNSTGQASKDSSCSTFLFSLINNKLQDYFNQVFVQTDKIYTLYSYADSGPCFKNNYDSLKFNKAKINSYRSNLSQNYSSMSYYQDFDQNYRLKEWEVYKIQFDL